MTPDEPTDEPISAASDDDDRDELIDLLASLRVDGVEPDVELIGRAQLQGVGADEVELRARTMADLRTDLLGLSNTEAATIAEDELGARRGVQRAMELAGPESTTPRAPVVRRHGRRIPTPVAVVAAVTVLVAGVGLGGWIVGQDTSEQLASSDAASSDVAEESLGSGPVLPSDIPVIGTATTPDEAIRLAERHWEEARSEANFDGSAALDEHAELDRADGSGRPPSPRAASPTPDVDRCADDADVSDVAVVVIDDQPHLVRRETAGAVVVVRLVDCREVGRA